MRIILAPMEGVVDYEMRDVLTRVGGYDRCVTEFIRVTDQLLPNKVYFRFSPELKQGGKTPAGIPVYIQLLGGSPKYMALNAVRAQKLQPPGIDINFGCPSKTVTNSDGGSALLREPKRVGDIVAAVREAVDPAIPVTAKIRLGFNNADFLDEVVNNIVNAGANELCIHARTRVDHYKPPAYWSSVRSIKDKYQIPIIINGEIWTVADAQQAKTDSGCTDIMLGRGALTCPDLANKIKASEQNKNHHSMSWPATLHMISNYLHNTQNKHPRFVSNRLKQWLVFLQRQYPESIDLFEKVKRLKDAEDVFNTLSQELSFST